VCRNESIETINNSSNADRYEWDFCFADLPGNVESQEVVTLTSGDNYYGMKMIVDGGVWYGFLLGRNTNNLIRLEFGNDPLSKPTEVDLGNVGGVLSSPTAIELVKEAGTWYGLVSNVGNRLVRLTFGDGLSVSPTSVENMGNLGSLNVPVDLSLVSSDDHLYAMVTNFSGNSLTVVDFGSSITTSIGDLVVTTLSVSATATGLTGISLLEESGVWYGLLGSAGQNKVYQMKFESGLTSVPTLTELATLTQPTRISLIKNGNSYYGIAESGLGKVMRYSFGTSISDTPSIQEVLSLSPLQSLELIKPDGDWFGYAVSSTTGLIYRIEFTDTCTSQSMTFSREENPIVSYDLAGTYVIELTAIHENGNVDVSAQTVTVINAQAPDIDFTTINQCIASQNVFAASSTVSDLTYSWD
ncbi:MAG: hypothetical protein JXQ96_23455, partial [Cyclobacteriaceae bacterium]